MLSKAYYAKKIVDAFQSFWLSYYISATVLKKEEQRKHHAECIKVIILKTSETYLI